MPDTPSEPISSLSASMHTAVRSGRTQLEQGGQGRRRRTPGRRGRRRRSGSGRSRCPPARKAGTAHSSAERKSSSTMPYFRLSSSSTDSFTRSLPSSSRRGRLPTRMFRLSAGMASPRGFFDLLGAQVGQQVVDGEHGVVRARRPPRPAPPGAVLQRHHAVELQGNGHPLVLADAAVVVGLEEGQLVRPHTGGSASGPAGGSRCGPPRC